ncbi:ROK family protein [Arthrobacter cavernae]|uniref:ROK family protein n=1 Tax=Arthrobacter cavernae TaxID=2817681 RepID=A0A939HA96_9MICC|nr:ROK family protein [Arthrobacter cavernae]MBO1267114.1 ROK family protein [Arthrobacter cavernae]
MSEVTAATPQLLRRVNAAAVLDVMRTSDVVTVTELMESTGLTRATALAVCEDLMNRGWIRELENQRDSGGYQKGRPARRFALDEAAGFVLGVDIGAVKATVVVADLRGNTVSRASQPFPGEDITAAERIDVINRTALLALHSVGASPSRVLAASVGIAAPVDRRGNVLASQPFWRQFDVGLRTALHELHGWAVLLENDANLAALGERWRGSAVGVDDLVVLLAGERMGAGLIEDGRLLHGRHGGAGEMAYLDLVEGVGSTLGVAGLARTWAGEQLALGVKTSLRKVAKDGAVSAEQVFEAAAAGDAVAVGLLERLAERLARIVATLSTIHNPELVVIGGAVAHSVTAMLDSIAQKIPAHTATPPRIAASPLGDAVVTVGAVRCALDYVEANSLDLELEKA